MIAHFALLALALRAPQPLPSAFAAGELSVAHSHNDYEQPRPLAQALEAGFQSVEADVWLRGGEIVVSHMGVLDLGRLADLYLQPLQDRVDRLGSVFGDGRGFLLWLDLKESSRGLTDALHALLARYPMFAAFSDQGVRPGAVVAILTGDATAKRRYTDEHPLRFACRDSNLLREGDPPADRRWTWYALRWSSVVKAPADAEEGLRAARESLRQAAERAHALGRRLRVYGIPERPDVWEAAMSAGVDLVSTDHIEDFAAYLETRTAPLAFNGPQFQ
jgi:hypothetical protein